MPQPMDETEIKAALMAMTGAIKEANGAATIDALNRVEQFLADHRAGLHLQFAHFLERRSYAKALAWIEAGNPVERGGGSFGNVA